MAKVEEKKGKLVIRGVQMDYYLFEDESIVVNMMFTESEIYDFIAYWKSGHSVQRIAKLLKRNPLDIALLVMDRAEVGDIEQRPNGIFEKAR